MSKVSKEQVIRSLRRQLERMTERLERLLDEGRPGDFPTEEMEDLMLVLRAATEELNTLAKQQRGGKERAAAARMAAAQHWTGDYYAEAWEKLQKAGRKRVGPDSLNDQAYLIARDDQIDPDKLKELTQYRAKRWRDSRSED